MNFNPVPAVDLIPKNHFLHKGKLGLVTNDVAINSQGIPVREALLRQGFRVARLFSPEHGLGANQPDGRDVGHSLDPLTGLPVISLYGEYLKPPPAELAGLDAVVFDIPDVGCRFYTYLWTMSYMMEACAEAGIPFLVLDRPNPIGGSLLWQRAHC